ncbi:class I SAM-dependent methyltransferase [Corynebacterium terpenotabidum]|uniref:Cyclopropane-fatty-acyl-phospholipid synthase n=1 Tax=Corynebacterium terpenotabidum Y-11 TaxID=1200352 RepID=S4XGD6_9CORY|nr:class I SAM-dependent methyltransferase [Corynebacterium terpenotabidum]AGP30715.1 cyclopropane-fatty-acyl-phospholipid synthase [Corynebacterium terpenotabidum Y-11]
MSEGYIDPERWPDLVRRPEAALLGTRAARVRERLETLTRDNGISLTPADSPHFFMRDGLVLDRIVSDGWLGLAEGYMAGEWSADPLPQVLGVLLTRPLEAGFGGFVARRRRRDFGRVGSGELPDALTELYTGETRATGSALFSSGVRTSATRDETQFGRNVSVVESWMDAPDHLDRADLDDAQVHRITRMLDMGRVGPGDRVLELPSSGGALAVLAARRGARVDVLTSDPDHADAVRRRAHAAGVGGAVRVETIRGQLPSPRQWSGDYDAVFSVERMEILGDGGTEQFLSVVHRMLVPGGVAVIQSVVEGGRSSLADEVVTQSLDVMRAYVWPALQYPTIGHVVSRANRAGLELAREVHLGSHFGETLRLWRSAFRSRERQAAAAGFDPVYRRLWDYQFALHEALVVAGALDCVQFILRRR